MCVMRNRCSFVTMQAVFAKWGKAHLLLSSESRAANAQVAWQTAYGKNHHRRGLMVQNRLKLVLNSNRINIFVYICIGKNI